MRVNYHNLHQNFTTPLLGVVVKKFHLSCQIMSYKIEKDHNSQTSFNLPFYDSSWALIMASMGFYDP